MSDSKIKLALLELKARMEAQISGASGRVFLGLDQLHELDLPAWAIWADFGTIGFHGLYSCGSIEDSSRVGLVACSKVSDPKNPLLHALDDAQRLVDFMRGNSIFRTDEFNARMKETDGKVEIERFIEMSLDNSQTYTAIIFDWIVS